MMIRFIFGCALVVIGMLFVAVGGDTAMVTSMGAKAVPESSTMTAIFIGYGMGGVGGLFILWSFSKRKAWPLQWTTLRNFGFKGLRGDPDERLLDACAPEGPVRQMYTSHEERVVE